MDRGKTVFLAPVEVDGKGSESQAWVDGEVRVGGATWKLTTGVGDALPMYGTGRVVITTEGWRVIDASLTSGASQTKLDARGSLGEGGAKIVEAVLGTQYARLGHALDVLAAFRGEELRLPFPLPLDAVVDGTASLDPAGTLAIDANARTDATDLALKLTSKGRTIERADLTGTVGPDELLPAWLDRVVDRAATEPFAVTLTGKGPLDALEGTLELEAPALASPWLRAPRPAGAKIGLRGGRRWSVEVAIDDAGTGQAQIGVAPYGSIDGAALLELSPGAWAVGELTAEGEPVQLEVQIGGSRSALDLKLGLSGTKLAVSAGGAALRMKRPRAKAHVTGDRGFRLQSATANARVGPGSAELTHDGASTRVRLARVDAADALAGLGLAVEQRWIGLGDEARFVVPDGAQLWGDLAIEDRRVSGQAHVETARSRLSLVPLRYAAGSFEGTEALATLDFDDAIALGLFEGSPVVPTGPGAADLHAKLTDHAAETRLEATATARRVGWRFRGGDEVLALEHAGVELALTREGLELRGVTATLFGGRLEARGGLRRVGERVAATIDALSLRGAHEGLRERLLGDRAGAAWEGLTVDLDLAGDLDALAGTAKVRSERSALDASVTTQGRAIARGSTVTGHVDPADLGPWTAPLVIEGEAMTVKARLEGDLARPSVALEVEGGEQRVVVGPVRAPLSNLRVRAALGADGLEVPEASAWVAGGRVTARGLVSRAFGGTIARLTVDGVRLGEIDRVSDELRGALHLDAAVWQRGGAPPAARVAARVEQPVYALLSRFAALFSRYGLRMPERSSSRPSPPPSSSSTASSRSPTSRQARSRSGSRAPGSARRSGAGAVRRRSSRSSAGSRRATCSSAPRAGSGTCGCRSTSRGRTARSG